MRFYPPSHFDDAANGCREIRTVPLAAGIGAEVQGVDVATVSDTQFEEIRRSLHRYKMLYFRDQSLRIEDQERFTLRFGEFGTDAYTSGMPDYPNVQRLVKEATTVVPRVFGETWHTDSPFLAKPPAISLLYAVEIPPFGGDTWWSNTELAFELLSDTMKDTLKHLRVHMSAREVVLNRTQAAAGGSREVGEIDGRRAEAQAELGVALALGLGTVQLPHAEAREKGAARRKQDEEHGPAPREVGSGGHLRG